MTRRKAPPLSEVDRAVIEAMANYDLRPGQMLLIGPKSARLLAGLDGGFQGKLPDKFVLERKDWNVKL